MKRTAAFIRINGQGACEALYNGERDAAADQARRAYEANLAELEADNDRLWRMLAEETENARELAQENQDLRDEVETLRAMLASERRANEPWRKVRRAGRAIADECRRWNEATIQFGEAVGWWEVTVDDDCPPELRGKRVWEF